jgi:hypothetical protein
MIEHKRIVVSVRDVTDKVATNKAQRVPGYGSIDGRKKSKEPYCQGFA